MRLNRCTVPSVAKPTLEFIMTRLIIVWLINTAALFAVPYLIHSVHLSNFKAALISAAILGLVNALIRPILVLLTLPVTIFSLGLFILVINGGLFWLTASWVSGFRVDGFWAAVLGALLYSIISWALSALILDDK